MAEIEKQTLTVRPVKSFTTIEYAEERSLNKNIAISNLSRMEKLGRLKKIKVPGSSRVYWQPITK